MRGPDSRHILLPREIIVDGSPSHLLRKIRHLIRIDGVRIALPYRFFRLFAILALRRDIDSGWVDRSMVIYENDLARNYMTRMREMIWTQQGVETWGIVEANLELTHFYRLAAEPETIRMNPELIHFDDMAISREAEAFISRAADRLICPQIELNSKERL